MKTQLGMLTQVGPENIYHTGIYTVSQKGRHPNHGYNFVNS